MEDFGFDINTTIFDDMRFKSTFNSIKTNIQNTISTMNEVAKSVPEQKKSIDFDYAVCKDSNGNIIDHTKYDKMVIHGESLDLFGIHHDDIVFIKPMTPKNLNNMQFPKTLIFHKEPNPINKSKFSICRVYATVNTQRTNNLNNKIAEIMNKRDFQNIKSDIRYVDNNYFMTNVLKHKSIPDNCYNVSIIARLNDEGYWVADFIPTNMFYGLAEYTFHKNDYYID